MSRIAAAPDRSLTTYVDDLTPGDVLGDLLERIRRQEIAWGMYARAIHEGAREALRRQRQDTWGERRAATEAALREALGMETNGG